jgi:hypothetical protein
VVLSVFSYQYLDAHANLRFKTALQGQYTENQNQIFPEIKLPGLSPSSYIHVSVNDLYIPTICLPILGKYVGLSWEYINRSQEPEWGNWDEAAHFLTGSSSIGFSWQCALDRGHTA